MNAVLDTPLRADEGKKLKKQLIGKLALSAVLAAASFLLVLASRSDAFMALYAPFSKWISAALGSVCSIAPFSLAEALLYALLLLGAFFTVRLIVRLVRGKTKFLLARYFVNAVLFFCAMMFAFFLLWGVNYDAAPLAERLELDVKPRGIEELYSLTAALQEHANALAARVVRDETGAMALPSFADTAGLVAQGWRETAALYPFFEAPWYPPVKRVASWYAMSRFGISGIYIPFTGECNVNPDEVASYLPATMAHEMAHRLSVAREDEANFAAFLCCVSADSDFLNYSGYYMAYDYALSRLYAAAPERALALMQTQSALLTYDRKLQSEHYYKYAGPVMEAASAVNNTYLKSMGQSDGVHSYGRLVDLLLAWYEREGA